MKGNEAKNEDDRDGSDRVATTTLTDFLIIYDDEMINFVSHETRQVIDNGISIHATLLKDLFTSYISSDFGTIKIGNNGLVKVTGNEDVYLEMNNGSRLVLKDGKFIPYIRLNLISTEKLDDDWYSSIFSNDQWKLTQGSMVVARDKKVSTLYILLAKLSNDIVNAMEDDSIVELWHKTLAHMSEK